MPIISDYIPKKDSDLLIWVSNFIEYILANAASWGIPENEISELKISTDTFITLYSQADSPMRNSVIVAEKNAARKTLVAQIRKLVSFRLKNPVITDAQRIAMGLHVHKGTYTKLAAPATRPELNIEVRDIRRLAVVFHDQNSARRARPYGVVGALIAYAALDVPPASPDDLTNNVLATRTPCTLMFTEMERGKTVYIAVCWQNRKGARGPWSEIVKSIVP